MSYTCVAAKCESCVSGLNAVIMSPEPIRATVLNMGHTLPAARPWVLNFPVVYIVENTPQGHLAGK
jgi:hypothetical protein